jgi:hypothetical protein
MKVNLRKIRGNQQSLLVGFERDEMTPQANMERLKALRLAKEAADKASGIKPAAVEGARMAKSRT